MVKMYSEEAMKEVARVSFNLGYDKGAKNQAEKMYDAKEVNNLLGKLIEGNICSVAGYKLIEEFKKKQYG